MGTLGGVDGADVRPRLVLSPRPSARRASVETGVAILGGLTFLAPPRPTALGAGRVGLLTTALPVVPAGVHATGVVRPPRPPTVAGDTSRPAVGTLPVGLLATTAVARPVDDLVGAFPSQALASPVPGRLLHPVTSPDIATPGDVRPDGPSPWGGAAGGVRPNIAYAYSS